MGATGAHEVGSAGAGYDSGEGDYESGAGGYGSSTGGYASSSDGSDRDEARGYGSSVDGYRGVGSSSYGSGSSGSGEAGGYSSGLGGSGSAGSSGQGSGLNGSENDLYHKSEASLSQLYHVSSRLAYTSKDESDDKYIASMLGYIVAQFLNIYSTKDTTFDDAYAKALNIAETHRNYTATQFAAPIHRSLDILKATIGKFLRTSFTLESTEKDDIKYFGDTGKTIRCSFVPRKDDGIRLA
ncbi:corneodesmosin-like [Bicyclus anynana]|uniref:Corneodesmosin-like n=1 Tax=Bicyclus anynana TaxID=110368 RepID=A0ABM3LQ55_BICAN|nr:corneodesmosin-like [Bicyclus anynana]